MGLLSRGAGAVRPLTDRFTYTARVGVASGLKRRGGLGFLPRRENDEERFIRGLDFTGKIVYDIGAFEGLFTIRFAQTARQVFTFEPHPWCQRQTMTNVAVNKLTNVSLLPVALGSAPQLATLSYPANEPARASIDPGVQGVLRRDWKDIRSTGVLVYPLDTLVRDLELPPPDFIKMDAEGAECEILRGAARTLIAHRPTLYIEIHGNYRAEVKRIVEEMGYSAEAIDRLHLYCTAGSTSRAVR